MLVRVAVSVLVCSVGAAAPAEGVVYWEPEQLAKAKQAAADPEATGPMADALRSLRVRADEALTEGPYSVTDNTSSPPSGDEHDYVSFGPYWWPNPDTADGLPFVRRDGVVNREQVLRGDRRLLSNFCNAVAVLGLASHLLDEPAYADHARSLVRVWFFDPATRMNPNLNYAQGVPGREDGRKEGVLDGRRFIRVLEAVSLMEQDGRFGAADRQRLGAWFAEYYTWLQTSSLAQRELAAKNNHGTWAAAQVARIALHVGDEAGAREIVRGAASQRVADQFADDGSQPHELHRTKSLGYTYFNLRAYAVLARVGERLGVDLWRESPLGPGIERGVRFAARYAVGREPWPHEQISPFHLNLGSIELLRMATVRYDDPSLMPPTLPSTLPSRGRDDETRLATLLFAAAADE